MRKLIFFMHTSLDGYVATPDGALNWVKLDEAMFDFVAEMTAQSDTALYGRVTYQMMEAYWPTAGDKPNASKHDKEHSQWYNQVSKIVLSRTLDESKLKNTRVVNEHAVSIIGDLKNSEGKNIIIFGSPSAANFLLQSGLVDEFWLFVNPVLLGNGMPLFKSLNERIILQFIESKIFECGVVALHYGKV